MPKQFIKEEVKDWINLHWLRKWKMPCIKPAESKWLIQSFILPGEDSKGQNKPKPFYHKRCALCGFSVIGRFRQTDLTFSDCCPSVSVSIFSSSEPSTSKRIKTNNTTWKKVRAMHSDVDILSQALGKHCRRGTVTQHEEVTFWLEESPLWVRMYRMPQGQDCLSPGRTRGYTAYSRQAWLCGAVAVYVQRTFQGKDRKSQGHPWWWAEKGGQRRETRKGMWCCGAALRAALMWSWGFFNYSLWVRSSWRLGKQNNAIRQVFLVLQLYTETNYFKHEYFL